MLKIIGAVLIVCGTAAWGLGSVFRMRNRVVTLRALIASMDILNDEICINLTPLPKVLELAGSAVPHPASELYKNISRKMDELPVQGFYGIWTKGLEESRDLTLGEAERDVLIRLGSGLGKYDSASQGRVILSARRNLERIAEQAERERAANSKLHAFLGIAAGMMAVVVLI